MNIKSILNSEILHKIIGILHLLFAIFISFYGFIFKKNWFDMIFIYYTLLVLISWTYFNGECCLTYYIKKNQNQNYIAGTESTDMKDMYLLFGSKEIAYVFVSITIIANITSEYIVLKRNGAANYICVILPFMHLLYTLLLRIYSYNLHTNKIFLFLQEIFKLFFIFLFLFMLCINNYKYIYNE